ncbi:MAG: hypothetical protein P8M80_04865 [Pirellulaceae bacterium]|nr:hypothetical protein [Pirellulaceae bacterium]
MKKRLLLVPTKLEAEGLTIRASDYPGLEIELCGFGMVEAAIQSAALIARYKPESVLLVGIAGLFASQANRIGSAACFERVAQYGIGSFGKTGFRTPAEMGLKSSSDESKADILEERKLETTGCPSVAPLLVTVPSSGLFDEKEILDFFKGKTPAGPPFAEDMEGYSVACAAAESRVQLTVFRGFSNVVGDRDVINWSIDQALNSVSSLVRSYLEAGEDDHQE